MAGADSLNGLPVPRAWSVAGLLLAVSDALASRFGAVTVRGEISGFTRAASGHCYFNLKDSEGQSALLRCAMFRRSASLLDFRPADGSRWSCAAAWASMSRAASCNAWSSRCSAWVTVRSMSCFCV